MGYFTMFYGCGVTLPKPACIAVLMSFLFKQIYITYVLDYIWGPGSPLILFYSEINGLIVIANMVAAVEIVT